MSGSELRDIKGLISYGGDFHPLLILFLIALGIGALLTFCMRKSKLRQDRGRSPYEEASQSLRRLPLPNPLDPEEVKAYYGDLFRIVTRYLKDRSGLTGQMTTDEWHLKLETIEEIPFLSKGLIRHCLTECDLVKFAQKIPSPHEIEEIGRKAQQILEMTKEETLPCISKI